MNKTDSRLDIIQSRLLKKDSKEQFVLIDIVKFILSVIIVCVHTEVFLSIYSPLQIIARNTVFTIAVPVFFCLSGFLFFMHLETDKNCVWGGFKKHIKKLFSLYVTYSVIYLPFVIYYWINNGFTFRNIIKYVWDFFFVGSFPTIWYLLALLTSVIIGYFLYIHHGMKKSILIALVFYIVGTLITSYYGLIQNVPFLSNMANMYYSVFPNTKNGIMFGLLFFLIGGYISQKKIRKHTRSIINICYL